MKLIDYFYKLNFGPYFQDCIELGWGVAYFSDLIKDEFNNHIFIRDRNGLKIKLKKINNLMRSKGRTPAIYFPNVEPLSNDSDILLSENYVISYSDSWMLFKGKNPTVVIERGTKIINVGRDVGLIDGFCEVFSKGYSGVKSQDNPYGGWSTEGFLDATRCALMSSSIHQRMEAYLIKVNTRLVACGLLMSLNKRGYLAGIASIPEVRGKGYGKLISLFLTQSSLEKGNKITFLATELKSKNEKFYSKLGYKTVENGYCYVYKT